MCAAHFGPFSPEQRRAQGRTGRDRLRHLRIAYGSVGEAQSAARIVVASGLGDGEKAAQLVAELDQLGALLWRLIRWAGG